MAASRGIVPWIILTPLAAFGLFGLVSQVYGLARGANPVLQILLYAGLVGIYLLVHWLVFHGGKGKALREVGPVIEELLQGKLVL